MDDKVIDGINKYIENLDVYLLEFQVAWNLKSFIIKLLYEDKIGNDEVNGKYILDKLLANYCEYFLDEPFNYTSSKNISISFYNEYKDMIYEYLNKKAEGNSTTMVKYISTWSISVIPNSRLTYEMFIVKIVYYSIISNIQDFIEELK